MGIVTGSISGDISALGVCGDIEEDDEEAEEEGRECCKDVSTMRSEFRERAFPLRYTPGGTVIDFNLGSQSIVGRFCRSAYVKYAVKCHLRGLDVGEVETYAEYACLTKPRGLFGERSKWDKIDEELLPRDVPSTKRKTACELWMQVSHR